MVDSANSMAAQRNGEPPRPFGVLNTAAPTQTNAPNSLPRYRKAVVSVGTGCRVRAIQRKCFSFLMSPCFPSTFRSDEYNLLTLLSTNSVNYEQVTCPAELVAKSGCSVSGYKAPSSVSTRSPAEDSSTVAATTEQQISSEQVSTSYAAAQTTGTTSVDTGNSETGAVTSAEVTPTGTVAPTGTSTAEGVVETGTTGAGGEAGQGEGEGEDDTCES